jgi:hypothetical protein
MLLKLPKGVRPPPGRLRQALLECYFDAEGVFTFILMGLTFAQTAVIFSVILPFSGAVGHASAMLGTPSKQATLNGKPLYPFAVDQRSGARGREGTGNVLGTVSSEGWASPAAISARAGYGS